MNKDITLEDLGYECNDYSNENNKNDDLYANYVYEITKKKNYQNMLFKEIAFFPNLKKVEIYYNDFFETPKEGLWSVEELQAIYNKCKELGWLDE